MSRSRIIICHGPLACEESLIAEVSRWVQEVRKDPSLLGHPLRVIVPSISLKNHLCASLVRRLFSGLAGVRIQTMQNLATELLEKSGVRPPGGHHLVGIIIRRHASREKVLREELGHVADGMSAIVGTVVDLLEAGLEYGHLEPVEELLCSVEGLSWAGRALERARAILRVAEKTLMDLQCWKIGLKSATLPIAQQILATRGSKVLGSGPLIIYGFADATGIASDFLESLLRISDAVAIIDHPPTPGDWEAPDPAIVFTHRLLGRLSCHIQSLEKYPGGFKAPGIIMFEAPGSHAECREIALSIQSLLRKGVRAEDIGVVVRDLEPYVVPLRQNFMRYGIPFSGISAKRPKDPEFRILGEYLGLLGTSEACATEIWLDLIERAYPTDKIPSSQILLAFRSMGAVRLEGVATLRLEALEAGFAEGYPLPLKSALEEVEEGVVPRKSKIPWDVLKHYRSRAISLILELEKWRNMDTPLLHHIEKLKLIAREHLSWGEDNPAWRTLHEVLEGIREDGPHSFSLSMEEFLIVVESFLDEARRGSVGGRGGGVQILDVMEARSRTFDHLFIAGLNQGLFPRPVKEDPLLPDWIRKKLLSLLPDLPIKERGYDEERYLFAQLICASPHVTISWQSSDDDGKIKSPSPFIHKLVLCTGIQPLQAERPPSPPLTGLSQSALRPVFEYGVLAGFAGRRDLMGAIMEASLRRAFGENTPWSPSEAAKGRLAVIEEMDPDLRTRNGVGTASRLGPYLGIVGPVVDNADPRNGDLYITTLEAMASCPWKTFLTRVLRIEPIRDPLGELQALEAWLVGKVVHGVLEELVTRCIRSKVPRTLEEAHRRLPIGVKWPEEKDLQGIIVDVSQRVLSQEGFRSPGWVDMMIRKVKPYVEVARRIDWSHGEQQVPALAAEVEGFVELPTESHKRRVKFRADRVDLTPEGLVFTDYKTGKTISEDIGETSRRMKLFQAISTGEKLQAAAYALSLRDQLAVTGRYVFLSPEVPDHCRVFQVSCSESDLLNAFERSTNLTLDAWEKGVFFPRVVGPKGEKEPTACRWCEVSLGCYRGDSGVRARLLRCASGSDPEGTGRARLEKTFFALWRLQVRDSDG